MFGGIPNSEIDDQKQYWDAFPSLRSELFKEEHDRPYSSLAIKPEMVNEVVAHNTDTSAFKNQYAEAFADFCQMLHTRLIDNVETVKDLEESDAIAEDIFRRVEGLLLIDKYAVYQILADNWPSIMGDIEIIQTEGYAAANIVETRYKMVKKDGVENEVPDGLKGRIIPFELIQHQRFQTELDAIDALENRVSDIDSELDTQRDDFTEDEAEAYLDSEKDNAFDKNKIKADAKPKADVEPETKAKLKKIVGLWEEQTKKNKEIKVAKQDLEDKTVEAIKNLSKIEIDEMLELKWIEPICVAITAIPVSLLDVLSNAVISLNEKYAETYNEVERKLDESQATLSELVSQLTGDEFILKGLKDLIRD
jgi:type I restriction enzyme M protein